MRVIKTKLYTLEELGKEAQQTALKNYNEQTVEFAWQEENLESMKKGLEFFNFKLKDYSFDYYCATRGGFDIDYSYYEEEEVINTLSGERLKRYIEINFNTYTCRFSNEVKETLSGNCPFTGYCADENFLDPIREFMKSKHRQTSFFELMEECVQAVAKAIETDYEYSQSMEYFKETCESNEYEFTEEGKQY